MRARVFITRSEGSSIPKAKAVEHSLHALGFTETHDVHIGKYVELSLDGVDRQQAERRTDEMCRKLLANGVIEDYRFELDE